MRVSQARNFPYRPAWQISQQSEPPDLARRGITTGDVTLLVDQKQAYSPTAPESTRPTVVWICVLIRVVLVQSLVCHVDSHYIYTPIVSAQRDYSIYLSILVLYVHNVIIVHQN